MRRALLVLMLMTLPLSAGEIDQARELMDEARYDQAGPILRQAARNHATRPEATLLLTRLCNAREQWQEGVAYGEQAVALLPASSEAHYQYAVALRIKMSSVSKVRAMFGVGKYKQLLRKAIALDPANIAARAEEIGFLVNAPTIAGGDLELAEQRIEELSRHDQSFARQLRAGLELSREDPEEAVELFKQLIARGPDQAGSS
jgi:tetratricopeptide (TPR) repeat protein